MESRHCIHVRWQAGMDCAECQSITATQLYRLIKINVPGIQVFKEDHIDVISPLAIQVTFWSVALVETVSAFKASHSGLHNFTAVKIPELTARAAASKTKVQQIHVLVQTPSHHAACSMCMHTAHIRKFEKS